MEISGDQDPFRTIISPSDTILVERTGEVLIESVEFAETALSRFTGLMFRKELPEKAGLWLTPCSSVHMMFMFFSIDVVWLDHESKVLKVSSSVPPWLGLAFCAGAKVALEIPKGRAAELQVGDQLIRKA